MKRRQFNRALGGLSALLVLASWQQAHALTIGKISNAQATQGLKAALEKGAVAAVGLLGRSDGFLGHPKVRIELPGYLNDAARLMKTLGQGQRVDELVTSMNRAAEAAVPMSKALLVDAVKSMTVGDAKKILTGGDTAVTDFFANKTRTPLGKKFLPVVTQATAKVGLARRYNAVVTQAAGLGLVQAQDANIEQYVTRKTLDGLYAVIGDEEKKIRSNPLGQSSELIKTVFGALR